MNITFLEKKETRINISTKLKEAKEHLNCGSDDGVKSAKNSIAEGTCIKLVKNRQKVDGFIPTGMEGRSRVSG